MIEKPIVVSIVDDHPLVIGGLTKLIEQYNQLQLQGTYTHPRDLFEDLKHRQPDLLLLDIQMPAMNGEEVISELQQLYPQIRVIALTAHDTPYFIQSMLSKGCLGYLLKNSPEEEIVSAIETVFQGKQFLAQSIRDNLLFELARNKNKSAALKEKLSNRELDILKLIVSEYTSKEISEKLFLSLRTVEKYRLNLLQKLEVKNTAGLVKIALQWNLLNG